MHYKRILHVKCPAVNTATYINQFTTKQSIETYVNAIQFSMFS